MPADWRILTKVCSHTLFLPRGIATGMDWIVQCAVFYVPANTV